MSNPVTPSLGNLPLASPRSEKDSGLLLPHDSSLNSTLVFSRGMYTRYTSPQSGICSCCSLSQYFSLLPSQPPALAQSSSPLHLPSLLYMPFIALAPALNHDTVVYLPIMRILPPDDNSVRLRLSLLVLLLHPHGAAGLQPCALSARVNNSKLSLHSVRQVLFSCLSLFRGKLKVQGEIVFSWYKDI